MPKKRVLNCSLDAGQSGDSFLFNLIIAPVAITANFFASLPGAIRALLNGTIHSRVPATLLIAAGALIIGGADTLARLGSTEFFQLGKLIEITLLFLGFLVGSRYSVRSAFRSPIGSLAAQHEPVASAGTGADRH